MAKYFFMTFIFIIVSASIFFSLMYKGGGGTDGLLFGGDKKQTANSWGGPPIKTALHDAVFKKTYEEIENMLNIGANPNAIDENGQTSLHFAAFFGRLDVVELLVDYGADPNIKDNLNWKPLNLVIEKPENEELLDYLEDITDTTN